MPSKRLRQCLSSIPCMFHSLFNSCTHPILEPTKITGLSPKITNATTRLCPKASGSVAESQTLYPSICRRFNNFSREVDMPVNTAVPTLPTLGGKRYKATHRARNKQTETSYYPLFGRPTITGHAFWSLSECCCMWCCRFFYCRYCIARASCCGCLVDVNVTIALAADACGPPSSMAHHPSLLRSIGKQDIMPIGLEYNRIPLLDGVH